MNNADMPKKTRFFIMAQYLLLNSFKSCIYIVNVSKRYKVIYLRAKNLKCGQIFYFKYTHEIF